MTQRIFDPHVHFFAYAHGDYHWLKREGAPFWPQKKRIQRDFSVADLQLGADFTLLGVTHVEAGFDNLHPIQELHWLQSQHFSGSAISFAQLDLPSEEFAAALTELTHPLLRGIRDITEGADGKRLLAASVRDNLALLQRHGLLWEAQFDVSDTRLTQALVEYAQNFSELSIVINHAGLVTRDNFAQWQNNLLLLAPYPNVHLKCSGWEIIQPDFDIAWQKQVIESAITSFSSARVMLASNFPLCLFACSYEEVWQGYTQLQLPDFDALVFANAQRLYKLTS
ncbi:amidohydrolase family protein [Pseudoalteromonas sp. YIC-656]|uniref:amidohydrolase family protein n=1 Tax=Pseudoalteromonas pernae TaxID=3118054 RepID=UPI003242DDCF